jgi:ribosomal protein S11
MVKSPKVEVEDELALLCKFYFRTFTLPGPRPRWTYSNTLSFRMSGRCAGRVRLALRCPQSTSLRTTNTKISTGSHWSRSYASLDAQPPTKSNSSQAQQTTTSDTSTQTRDPLLPVRPPLGTYPHPFSEGRDDPHSNSMRINFQLPGSMSPQGLSRSKLMSPLAKGARYKELNALSGIATGKEAFMDPSSAPITPIYVIHVKSSSNNTIITLHGPSTPKSLVVSGGQDSRSANKTRPGQDSAETNFSVKSNPDAVEEDFSTESTSNTAAPPMRMSSTFTLPTADRCIGWASGGSCHYKKVNRSTYEAGYAASVSGPKHFPTSNANVTSRSAL